MISWSCRRCLLVLLALSVSTACGLHDGSARQTSVTATAAGSPLELADPPGLVQRRLKQLTGTGNTPTVCREADLADPAPPQPTSAGAIRVTGTGSSPDAPCPSATGASVPVWPDWRSFLRADPHWREALRLYQPAREGQLVELDHGETAWDVTIERALGGEVLWGGIMLPTNGQRHAIMWDDNWTRRVWPFLRDDAGRWIRQSEPLFGKSPDPMASPTYQDHFYGHQFILDEHGDRWVFYERVSETKDTLPWRTDLYARRMLSETRASDEEHFILSGQAMRSAIRTRGDVLVEGPRPTRVELGGQSFYLIGFSAGDFRSPSYGLHFAVSRHLLGPYHPYLTPERGDFLDLGGAIRQRYGLSAGPGRPVLFADPTGAYWLLFHAVDAPRHGQNRNVYLAPVDLTLGPDGWPVLTLSDNNLFGAAAGSASLRPGPTWRLRQARSGSRE